MTYEELFPDVESKAKAYDEIAALYFNSNFGKLSKGDFETLMFHQFVDRCMELGINPSDYQLSKVLGITQSRIRNLKVKKELQYPYKNFKWEETFASYVPNARYDETTQLIKLHIPDVNVLIELRNHMEEHGWYDEYQLNPKLFQCRMDLFIALCNSLNDEKLRFSDEDIRKIEALDPNSGAWLKNVVSGTVEDVLKEILKSGTSFILCEALKLLPGGGIASVALKGLINVLGK